VSVQFAAALPLAVLPLPLFLLGKRLVTPAAAVLGTTLVVGLPELAGLGAEGLSDSTYLLALSVALTFLVYHLQPVRPSDPPTWPVLAAGAATALAALARSEALVLAAAFGILVAARAIRRREWPWRSAVPYLAGLAMILGPYGVAWATVSREVVSAPARLQRPSVLSFRADARWLEGEAPSFAAKDPTTSIRHRGLAGAGLQLLEELPRTFAYFPGVLVLIGFAALRRRPASDADRLLQTYCVLFLGAIVFHTAREGYLSARHLLPLAVVGTACLGAGSLEAADWLARAFGRAGTRSPAGWAAALVLATAAVCTASNLQPHHPNRIGHRSAARWLAENGRCGDHVVDTLGWTGLYSGLVTVPYGQSRGEWSSPSLRYLVVEDRELAYASRRSRTILGLTRQAGTLVARFSAPPTDGHAPCIVLVYRWNAHR
ncbi:MAG: glycosyltransferase family 39 protein, partial [Thermoguttaceae bacterium]